MLVGEEILTLGRLVDVFLGLETCKPVTVVSDARTSQINRQSSHDVSAGQSRGS